MSVQTRRVARRQLSAAVAATALLAVATGCGDSGSSDDEAATPPASTSSSSSSSSSTSSDAPAPPAIVGLWQQTHTCAQLVAALSDAHLEPVIPAWIGDYFPGTPFKQLEAKADPCSGATPQVHAHFFSADGEFGSLDGDGNRVDDGHWKLLDDDTIRISDGTFDFEVDGDTLVLHPVITARDRKDALAAPLDYSTAGWQVSVAYGGRPWQSAPCDGWC